MSRNTFTMSDDLYEYFLKNSLREDPLLTALREETAKLSAAKMQISPEQGQFMAFLMQLLGAQKTLDIGVFTGYSALVVAKSLPEQGRVIACDINTEWTKMAKKYWTLAGQAEKISLEIAPATDTLQKLIDDGQEGTFDFAFIDADKTNYLNYYELSLSLLRQGGVVAVDNVLWGGRVADVDDQDESTQAIREFNKTLHVDQRVAITMLPIGDGLTLARKL